MNQGLFRLVFSKHLGMFVPAPEVATAQTAGSASSARSRRRALLAVIMAMLVSGEVMAEIIPLPSSGLVVGGGNWVGAEIVGATPVLTTIQQNAPQAIANWLKFNLAAGHTLDINQQAGWSMLHRIHDNDPSIIAGTITGKGNNYFLNNNGIIFAGTAQVNLGSVWAMTSSSMTDTLFTQGFINNLAGETFSNTGGFIKVEAGAKLTAATGGKVVLLAKDVENHGIIVTPEGQTILAAGEKVYLKSQDNQANMLVEVDGGGTATNLGEILAQRGNVTLIGLAVNQMGTIKATTSVRANGSIHLLARDSVRTSQVSLEGGGTRAVFQAERFGTVNIGANSVTEVAVETDNPEKISNKVTLPASNITVQGRSIDVQGKLLAKGGVVNINALADANPVGGGQPIRVLLGDTARIDVSGVDTTGTMDQNQLVIRFYSEEAKDTPLLKGSPLLGQTLYVDARKGTSLFDITPYLEGQTQTIAQRMSAGGTVNITSAGDVITKSGSVIDVSGGVIDYAAGVIRESSLVYNNKIVAISKADRNTPYNSIADVLTITDPKTGMSESFDLGMGGKYQQAYRQGKDAGTVNITSSGGAPVLEGSMVANTRHDITQRSQLPDGGKFNLTVGSQTLRVADRANTLDASFQLGSNNAATEAVVDTKMLDNGFNHIQLTSMGDVIVDKAISTAANGSVGLKGDNISINKNITTPGGDITATTQTANGNVHVADNVTLSTAGTWANDTRGMQGAQQMPVALDGGNITLDGNQLTFGQNTKLDTSAGAWLNSKGELATGGGGNITLHSGTEIVLPTQMQAYGFNKGGQLAISTLKNVHIGGQDSGTGFWLGADFFEQGGFSHYAITSTGSNSEFVVGDTSGKASVIHPKMQTLQITPGYAAQASANNLTGTVAAPVMKSAGLRAPATLAFAAYNNEFSFGTLTVLENTTIRTDIPDVVGNVGKVTLTAGKGLHMLGSIITPAGDVAFNLNGNPGAVGYDNTQAIWLGERSVIDVSGYYLRPPVQTNNLLMARVYDAGTVTLNANLGFVVAKEGSKINVSGTSGQVDLGANAQGRYISSTLYGAAGDIIIKAREGALLDGDFIADVQGTGQRGSFSLSLESNATPIAINPAPPTGERVLTVTSQKQVQAGSLNAGDSLAAFEGKAQISTEQIDKAQFDHVSLASKSESRDPSSSQHDRIQFEDGVRLKAGETLHLETPRLSVMNDGTVDLQASHIMMSSPSISNDIVAGNGLLRATADWIDLSGHLNFSGINRAELTSRLDIRMRGQVDDNKGSLVTPGSLVMTGRQLYPVTNSEYTIKADGAGSTVKVKSSGEKYKPVFSAGGKLTIQAEDIEQDGVVLAPLGELALEATDTLTLGAGSLTSTSAAGLLIPYGVTRDGGSLWDLPGGATIGGKPMEKRITLSAPNVDMSASNAVVDISGSGDTFAYEFINGLGGSKDILIDNPNTYAILPSLQGDYAPYDYNYYNYVERGGAAPAVGSSIYISGGNGIAAGYYTLMPARYALLEGAYMVELQSGKGLLPGVSTTTFDGSILSSGFFSNVNQSSRATNWSTFRLTSGAVFRDPENSGIKVPAEYLLSSGNEFFTNEAKKNGTAVPRLAVDAGQLVLAASERLSLGSTVKTDVGLNGRGALVDIVSSRINVVSSVGPDNGTLQVTAEALNKLNAESLLLGGRRNQGQEGLEITTVASEVNFANTGAEHELKVEELLATATDKVSVASDVRLSTKSSGQVTDSVVRVNGDGALLGISGKHNLVYDRVATSGSTLGGTLDIAAGSQITAHESLVLDATGIAHVDGNLGFFAQEVNGQPVPHGSLTLGANNILVGDADPALDGLRVDDSLLSSFGNLRRVTLNSRQNLNFYGDVSLGNADLDITINAAGISGHAVAGNADVTLITGQLTLKNSTGAVYTPVSDVAGSKLNINAGSIAIEGKGAASPAGAGNFNVGGFEQVAMNSEGGTVFSGNGALAISAQQVSLSSQRVTAATGTNYAVNASQGSLSLTGNGSQPTQASNGIGAKLDLTAREMELGGNIELLAGQLKAKATQGNLDVVAGANINAGSKAVAFDKYTAHTPGGLVALQSDHGNIRVMDGAVVNVGGGSGGNAGTISMTARNGSVEVAANSLKGQAAEGNTGGSFLLDSKTMTDFSTLNAALNAGGFDATRNLRLRDGDFNIAAADVVKAQNIILSADNGSFNLHGTLDASGQQGGKVKVFARNDLNLKAGSKVLAKAEASDGKGGDVLLSSDTGTINAEVFSGGQRLADAAVIDVSGNTKGEVTMRAERVGASGLKVATDAPAAITGASKVVLESLKVINSGSTINAATLATVNADTTAFYSGAGTTADTYQATSDGLAVIVAPHTEIRTTGTTTIGSDLNLATLSQGRDGSLTIRSTGDLNVNGTISDGFNGVATTSTLGTGQSWSINLVAGADMSAANYMATLSDNTIGNMTLANDKMIRTGTGDIHLAAAGKFTLGNGNSVIYTAGRKADDLAGYTSPTGATGIGSVGTAYLTNGGDITIETGSDITGALLDTTGRQQLINNWLFRQGGGNSNLPVSWWLRTDQFRQGVAAFGGGDVNVTSGGSVTNLSVSVPTTGRFVSTSSNRTDGGGNIKVQAAGDINNGVYYAGRGDIALSAGGDIANTGNTFGTVIALQDATASLSAVGDVFIEAVINPTLFAQSNVNAPGAQSLTANGLHSSFNTYSERAGLEVSSLTGNVSFGDFYRNAITNKMATAAQGLLSTQSIAITRASLGLMPGTLEVTAYNGSIKAHSDAGLILMPSSLGNLSLLAGADIQSPWIIMSDADPAKLPGVFSPVRSLNEASNSFGKLADYVQLNHATTPLHINNPQEVVIVARDGTIGKEDVATHISLPKAASIIAGLDILNLNAGEITTNTGASLTYQGQLQNLSANNLTIVKAGRDILQTSAVDSSYNLAGPGNFLFQAGRHFNLGASGGLNSVANTINSYLPDTGASITVLAGVGSGPKLADYINAYINPNGDGPAVLAGNAESMAAYREATLKAVAKYVRDLGDNAPGMTDEQAMTKYLALDHDKQAIFAYRHYSSELLASGEADAALKASGESLAGVVRHKRGDDAVAMLFPRDIEYQGDLTLFDSKINTLRDGSIDILVPGGMVNVGIPGRAVRAGNGIVTENGGEIRAFAETNFQVNQSRVVTQFANDMTIWVNNGNIDAGKGSRSAVAVPEQEIFTDAWGNMTRRMKGASAGSGIQVQSYDPDGPSGPLEAPSLENVTTALITPRGTLDAGEAGIAGGRILAVADRVLNAGNIVGTTTVGVPLASMGTLAGSLTGTSNVASATTATLGDMVNLPQNQDFSPKNILPSFVSVEVLGLGNIVK